MNVEAGAGRTVAPPAWLAAMAGPARPPLEAAWRACLADGSADPARCVLFFAATDGARRAHVAVGRGGDFDAAWRAGMIAAARLWRAKGTVPIWLRVEAAVAVRSMAWGEVLRHLAATKRNYWRHGIAFDARLAEALLPMELAGNAVLYDASRPVATPNANNLAVYARRRFGRALRWPDDPAEPVWLFGTRAVFSDGTEVHEIEHEGRHRGYRRIPDWGPARVDELVRRGAGYLARQVGPEGRYDYGCFPCFDRPIPTYNALRHASSTYALLEGWEATGDPAHRAAAESALGYLCGTLIREATLPDGTRAAFLVDTGDEIKLGGNAVCLLALGKHAELTGDRSRLPLMAQLALGILHMQDPDDGSFVHVLRFPSLALKARRRTIYYDGEAAFGLMRLYGLTRDPHWLAAVERAFDHFIAAEHWRAHDHWLGYCVNELTRYRPDPRYYRFGLDNVRGYLDFVLERITTFPTLLEMMMAARRMIDRLQADPANAHLLDGFDLDKFERALEFRARYLAAGMFWPETAMFFRNPARILDGFFIRHHGFRVRIDDVEHYLSGLVAYGAYLRERAGARPPAAAETPAEASPTAAAAAIVAWAGDINLGRRQHAIVARHGARRPLEAVPALREADLAIANLECVVATRGQQGVDKGEGGPFYYRARPEMLAVLVEAGIGLVATANNHSGDYGPEALLEQAHWLDACGIAHAGSGPDLERALRPAYVDAGPLRIAVFSLDATQPRFAATTARAGTAYLAPDAPEHWRRQLAPRVAKAMRQADVALAAVHWGGNGLAAPEPQVLRLGEALIEAGFHAVLGASAHTLQGVRLHRGRPIVHDAGDLLFDARARAPAAAAVFHLELDAGGVRRVIAHPLRVAYGRSIQLQGEAARAAAERYAAQCRAFGTPATVDEAGRCVVALRDAASPVPDDRVRRAHAPARRVPRVPAPLATPAAPWCAAEVPADARFAQPLPLGPLELLGVRTEPATCVVGRRMLFIESWWRLRDAADADWRIEFRAVPEAEPDARAATWGLGSDHDPCDWMWPTRRWQPGRIHRDRYGLRPPPMADLRPGRLRLQVLAHGPGGAVGPMDLPRAVELLVPARAPAPVYRVVAPEQLGPGRPDATWTAAQLAAATGGRWRVEPPPDWRVQALHHARDGRRLAEFASPPLFLAFDYATLALHERYGAPTAADWDTHDALPRLHARLAGAVVARPVPGLPADFPLLEVADPVRAFLELGAAARQRLAGRVVAVTGSAGKSTLVQMLAQALAPAGRVAGTRANYNSRCGMLFALANAPQATDLVVLEVSAAAINAPRFHNIRLVRPDVAVVTNVAPSHLAPGQTVADVARRKIAIVEGMAPGAPVVLWSGSAHYADMRRRALAKGMRVIAFGTDATDDVRLLDAAPASGELTAGLPGGRRLRLQVGAPGEHMALNALACLAVLLALDLPPEPALPELARFRALAGRGQTFDTTAGGRRLRVVDEAYNANPASMAAALRLARDLAPPLPAGRRVLVLGDMRELGTQSDALHAALAPEVLAAAPAAVLLCGAHMTRLADALRAAHPTPAVQWFPDAQALAPALDAALRDGDLVLIKASAGTRLGPLVDGLRRSGEG